MSLSSKKYRIVKETKGAFVTFNIQYKPVGTDCWHLLTSRSSFSQATDVVIQAKQEPITEVVWEDT